nr:immunoglobulin light chain junction region [Macaca mulatta]MOY01542.1 immunoglobulin light chain junction region [Macaca mulatta]
CQQGYIKPLTF